jgi:hypothetical protein
MPDEFKLEAPSRAARSTPTPLDGGAPTRAFALLFVVALGCAGVPQTPERSYRVVGMTSRVGTEPSSTVLRLPGGVELLVEVTGGSDVLRVRTIIENRGGELVKYDLAQLVVTAPDGEQLRLIGTDVEPSGLTPPGGVDRSAGSVHAIDPGQHFAVVRRYELRKGLHRSMDPLLLARVHFTDLLRIGKGDQPVKLTLEEAR